MRYMEERPEYEVMCVLVKKRVRCRRSGGDINKRSPIQASRLSKRGLDSPHCVLNHFSLSISSRSSKELTIPEHQICQKYPSDNNNPVHRAIKPRLFTR
jgi:hypothetical protein